MSSWIDNVKKLLNYLGFSGFWNDQYFSNAKWLSKAANHRLSVMFIQEWLTNIDISSQTNTYRSLSRIFSRAYIFQVFLINCAK